MNLIDEHSKKIYMSRGVAIKEKKYYDVFAQHKIVNFKTLTQCGK